MKERKPHQLRLPRCARWSLEHLEGLYSLYGEELGVRIARKHIGWYTRGLPGGEAFRREAVLIVSRPAQLAAVGAFFDGMRMKREHRAR
jgi:tRNA-dihydrouridine synthase B